MSIQHPVVRDDLEGMEAALASADGPRDGFLQPLELLPEDETPADGAPDSDGLHGTHRGERDPQEAADRERRKRRRAQWEKDQQDKRRWDLQRRLADISTDVELLSREVC